MKIVTGFLTPSEGSVTVCGHDVARDPIEIKRRIGSLPEGAPLYGDLTPRTLVDLGCNLRRLSAADRNRGIASAGEKLDIEKGCERPIEPPSKGYKRRGGLSHAIGLDPEILIR